MRRIFAELQGAYGSRFLDMWRTGQTLSDGSDAGLANAQRLWGERLAGFEGEPERVKRALACLPPHPPTLPEFLASCRQQTAKERPALPAPTVSDEVRQRRQREIENCVRSVISSERSDCRGWARDLRADYLAGQRLMAIQIEMASGALGEVWADGKCRRAG